MLIIKTRCHLPIFFTLNNSIFQIYFQNNLSFKNSNLPPHFPKKRNEVVVPCQLAITLNFLMVSPIGLTTTDGVANPIDASVQLIKGNANSSSTIVYCEFKKKSSEH